MLLETENIESERKNNKILLDKQLNMWYNMGIIIKERKFLL